jgi:hypothetical protein
MKTKLNKLDNGWMLLVNNIMYATDENAPYARLSVKNCESIERGYDLDELAEEWIDVNSHKWSNNNNEVGDNYGSFKQGFQKSIELNKNKLFTLEDMMNCWNKALKFQDHKETLGEYITSLQQTEWDVEIVEECLDPTCDGVNRKGECITTGNPKLDSDGCLILRKI